MFAIDNNGSITNNIKYEIVNNSGSYQLKLSIDPLFLEDPSREYPIVIDPSINLMITGASVTYDSFVSSQSPTTNYKYSTVLRTGCGNGYGIRRTYIMFTIPTYLNAETNVSSAYLRIEKISGIGAIPNITAYKVDGYWDSGEVTWNNKPTWSTASTVAYNDSGNWYRMNCLTPVRSWLSNPNQNYGWCIKDATESGTSQWTDFYSSDATSPHKPELHIVYDDNRFLAFGYPSASVPVKPSYEPEPYNTAIINSRASWNNTNTIINFYTDDYAANEIESQIAYEWQDVGRCEYISVSGTALNQFRVCLNESQIESAAQTIGASINIYAQSVCVHELGHAIWLNDNPVTGEPSIMKYNRNRGSMDTPSSYDTAGVNLKY